VVRRGYYCFSPIQQRSGGDSSDPLARVLGQTSVRCSSYWVLVEAFLKIDGHDRRALIEYATDGGGKNPLEWHDRRTTDSAELHTPSTVDIYSCTTSSLTLSLPLSCTCLFHPISLWRGWLIRSCPWRFARWTDSNWQGFSSAVDHTATHPESNGNSYYHPTRYHPSRSRTTTRRPLAGRRRHENVC